MDNAMRQLRLQLGTTAANVKLLMLLTIVFFAGGQFSWSQRRALLEESNQHSHLSQKPPILYGHAHIAKTSGSNLNGAMALRYSHICGNKGYSYDAYQLNLRRKKAADTGVFRYQEDIYTQIGNPQGVGFYNRGRVPTPFVKEIGFEECDWISLEGKWEDWVNIAGGPFPLELHVPCRDPVDHLMSQCNHIQKQFNCQAEDLRQEIDGCIVKVPERFNKELEEGDNNVSLRCFDFRQNDSYLDMMEDKLETRRIQGDYLSRKSNSMRDKENECIWKDPSMMEFVESYLLKTYDYYDFCNRCMHSENDLFVYSPYARQSK